MNEISTEEQIYSCLGKIPCNELNSFLIRKEGNVGYYFLRALKNERISWAHSFSRIPFTNSVFG